MEVITKYRANDGQEFETEELCLAHERAIKTAFNAIKIIQSNCQSFYNEHGLCTGCPFAYISEHDNACCVITNTCPINWKVPD